jgi:predicted PurR-regulated permease PerM
MRLNNLEGRVFLGLVLATTGFFLWMMRDFLMSVFWAVVFAVLFRPTYLRTLRAVKGRPNVAALLTTIAVILVVVIPASILVTAVARQAMSLYTRAAAGELNLDAPIGFIERTLPQLTEILERYGVNVDQARTGVETAAVSGTQWVAVKYCKVVNPKGLT